MIFRLLMFVAQLGAREHLPAQLLVDVAIETRVVVLDEGALPQLDELQTALLVARWTFGESRWNIHARNGASIGVGQIGELEAAAEGVPPAALRGSLRAQLLATLRYMRSRAAACGGLLQGLGAYATGKCGGAPLLVRGRLLEAGIVL